MIIFGAIGLISSIGSIGTNILMYGILLMILSIIIPVVEIIAGIMGVIYSGKQEKAKTCILTGLIYIALIIVQDILIFTSGIGILATGFGFGPVLMISAIVGLIIPKT